MEEAGYFDDFAHTAEKVLLLQLYDKIIAGELTTFDSLKKAVSKYKDTPGLRKCLFRAFELQRKLYWGFFRDVTPKMHPDLWKALVLPDQRFRFGGDLKRLMSIPEIYLGLLDIHGYTQYCHDKKRNISMIDLLDRMIYEDVDAICAENGVISKRAQGDEILIIGASTAGVLKSVLNIMEYFNTQGRSFRNTVLSRKLPGTVLPKFQISAGIAGGQKFTPLVITRDGDVSGDIVNTAARLQSKANKVSPDKNRIMITSHVYQKFKLIDENDHDEAFEQIDFFNVGTVKFKGRSLNVFDVIFLPDEDYRLKLRSTMDKLYASLDKKQWKTRIMRDALDAAAKTAKTRIEAGFSDTAFGRRTGEKLSNILDRINKTHTLINGMYYEAAIGSFSNVVSMMWEVEDLDRIVLDYMEMVKQSYLIINEEYSKALDDEVSLRLNELCTLQEKEKFLLLRKHRSMYEKIKSSTRLKLQNRRMIWHRITDSMSDELNTVLHSQK